jgi:hypothetical protein
MKPASTFGTYNITQKWDSCINCYTLEGYACVNVLGIIQVFQHAVVKDLTSWASPEGANVFKILPAN